MRRRWTRVASVACLILVILGIGSRGLAREIGGKHTHAKREEKRPPKESAFKVVTVGLDQCKSKKKIDACSHNIRAKKNDSLIDDDKRAVPTGPNPLHNR